LSEAVFGVPSGVPYNPEYPLWAVGAVAKPWDFNGWKPESLSWKNGCYIHGGLSGPGQVRYRGPEVIKFLEHVFVNNFSRFKVGVAKHAIACNEEGLVAGHGVLQRLSEDEFQIFVHGLWGPFQHSITNFDVEQSIENNYLFQVAGPKCIDVLRAVTGEDLSDIAFLRFKQVMVAGRKCEIMRIGMAGALAYELHGPIADGPDVYNAVLAAGQAHGIEQLGWKTYYVNHVEAGFPQQIWTFLPATYGNPDFARFASTAPTYRVGPSKPLMCGSVDPADMRARYRTPQEVGWGRSVVFDHEFIGRPALEREMASPKRTIVTLEWNDDDVLDVFASHFRPGPEFKIFEFPVTPHHMGIIGHADHVVKGGRDVGIASGVAYSYHFRKILSHCTIDIDQAEIGNEVIVRWGDHGGAIKDIRAQVAQYPYLTENRNQVVVV
jgi:glycine cleavage system aminomethyltransferase T